MTLTLNVASNLLLTTVLFHNTRKAPVRPKLTSTQHRLHIQTPHVDLSRRQTLNEHHQFCDAIHQN